MTEAEFKAHALAEFQAGELIVVSGVDDDETNRLLCEVKTDFNAASRGAMVYNALEVVGYPRDVFYGSSFWTARNYYRKGEYVFPSSYVDDGVLYNVPINCASSILLRFKYKCLGNGMSGGTEPTWPTSEGDTVSDNATSWETVSLSYGGLTWEMILLNARQGTGFVALAHNEFDPNGSRALTGDLATDAAYDLMRGFGPAGNVLKHKAYWTRDIYPYYSRLYYHEGNSVQLIKVQVPDR